MTAKCPRCGGEMPSTVGGGVCPRCAAALLQATQTEMPGGPENQRAFTPPSVAELAPAFPQLEILELLGRGGMGAVYKARQKELDRIVALKILPPGIRDDPAFAERFAREAKALARLDHPGIVTIHDFGRADGLYYLLMEFVDGVTLRRLLEGGRVSPREALAIVPQICDALQYAHDQGIVHRDIKPDNILLDRRGRVKVADFGLAKLVGVADEPPRGAESAGVAPGITDARKVLGTPAYMAPEQAERPAEVDHRADIYALGVVFYQMLTGELPPKPLEPPSRKVRIDVRLDEIVLHALEKEPERRYQQAGQIKTAVETIAAGSPGGPSARNAQGEERASAKGPQDGGDHERSGWRRWWHGQQGWPAWWHIFVAGMLTVLLAEFGIVSFSDGRGPGVLLLGLLAVGSALAVLVIIGRKWLVVVLAGIVVAFLLWLAVIGAIDRQFPLAIGAGALAIAVSVFTAVKLRPPRGFGAGFATVFLLVFGAGAAVTFLLPDSYSSTARIRIDKGGPDLMGGYDPYFITTELVVIGSEAVLGKVIERLGLNEEWNKRYARGEQLRADETLALLESRLAVHPVRNASIVEIRAFDEKPDEAAAIANEVARAYAECRANTQSEAPDAKHVRVTFIDRAVPARRPARPNKPLNLALAALAGLLLGTAAGAGVSAYQAIKIKIRNRDQ